MMAEDFGVMIEDSDMYRVPSYSLRHNEKSFELHEWQEKAIKYFFETRTCIIEASTGTGKTKVGIEIIRTLLERHPKFNILIVVPKNVILESGWYKELADDGISLKDIGVFYGSAKEMSRITITNMQSIKNLDLERFQILILDEVHNYATSRLMEFWKSYAFPYKLGMTATLDRADMKHLNLLKLFDYNIFKYDARQALHDKVLNSFHFMNIEISLDKESYDRYQELTRKLSQIYQSYGSYHTILKFAPANVKSMMLSLSNARKELLSNYHKKFGAMEQIVARHKENKVIIFNNYNKQTSKCYWGLLEVGIKACLVHSSVKKDVREKNIIDFRNDKYNVMLTSKMLDEGYNLPSIDVGIIMAGDTGARQTIQRMGRVLRKKAKPSYLYQIYIKDTVEEVAALKRTKLFKYLCSSFNERYYDEGVVLWKE